MLSSKSGARTRKWLESRFFPLNFPSGRPFLRSGAGCRQVTPPPTWESSSEAENLGCLEKGRWLTLPCGEGCVGRPGGGGQGSPTRGKGLTCPTPARGMGKTCSEGLGGCWTPLRGHLTWHLLHCQPPHWHEGNQSLPKMNHATSTGSHQRRSPTAKISCPLLQATPAWHQRLCSKLETQSG